MNKRTKKTKKGDMVIIISGKFKGKRGVIKEVDGERVRVEGVNLIKRFIKQRGKRGEAVEIEGRIHHSNVALVDPKVGKATRVGFGYDADGKKFRFAKLSGERI